MSTLILNADGMPVSLLPLSVLNWQEAIQYLVLAKASVLEWHDDWVVRSANWSTRVPAVMMLNQYQRKKHTIRFSKQNVFLRDEYRCAYCETGVSRKTATLDHVLPTSLGGQSTFENCVTACNPCNSRKGNDSKVVPKTRPYKPNYFQLVEKRKRLGWENLAHPSWRNYLEY